MATITEWIWLWLTATQVCALFGYGKRANSQLAGGHPLCPRGLGCNCPDEVFRRVEVQPGSSVIRSCSADCELRIGGRLLIVVTSEPAEKLSSRLERVIAEGRRARDESKFNRFRLVVRTGKAAEDRETLLRAFEAVPEKDERTHLHVLEKGEVPNFFLPRVSSGE